VRSQAKWNETPARSTEASPVVYGFLHPFVARAAAAFGGRPADVVERALPLTGLAVQAVRRVGGLDLVVDRLVDARRAERNARRVQDRAALRVADRPVENCQVRGLLLAMGRRGHLQEVQPDWLRLVAEPVRAGYDLLCGPLGSVYLRAKRTVLGQENAL